MFVPKYFFEKFIALLESQYHLSQRQTEDGLQRVLAAKNAEVAAVVAAKDVQIAFMEKSITDLQDAVNHERTRAEAAIDILLTRDGGAGPVRNADLIRAAAEREAMGGDAPAGGIPRPAAREDAVKQIFAQVNDVLGDDLDDDLGVKKDEVVLVGGVPLV